MKKAIASCTKSELAAALKGQSTKLEAYRKENEQLHAKLEEHGTPHNVCDTVTEFFDDIINSIEESYDWCASKF